MAYALERVAGLGGGGGGGGGGNASTSPPSSPPPLPCPLPPPGSILFLPTFCVDRHPLPTYRAAGRAEDVGDVPAYTTAHAEGGPLRGDGEAEEGEEGEAGGAGGGAAPPSREACFNCGRAGHSFKQCPRPADRARVARALAAQRRGAGGARYTDPSAAGVEGRGDGAAGELSAEAAALAARYPHARAGALSDQLRAALGMPAGGGDEPPPFARRAARWGVPPAYLRPVPAPPAAVMHWGYAGNGPVSAFVALFDGQYAEGVTGRGGGVGDGGECAGGAVEAAEAVGVRVFETAEAAEAHAVAAAAASAAVPTVAGLLDAPLAAPLRLHPYLPACTCGATAAVPIPWLGLHAAGEAIRRCLVHEGAGQAAGVGASAGRGEGGAAAPAAAEAGEEEAAAEATR